MYDEIQYDVDDPVATITLDRPASLNAWTTRMGAEVRHAVAAAEADPAVVGIVLTGAGRAFCAGADMQSLSALSEGGSLGGGGDDVAVPPDPTRPTDLDGEYTYLLACRKPIVAAINGAVAGMAVPIVLCCDVRFMAADAPFVTAFAERGLIAEWGLSWLLPRLVGVGAAMDLLLSSRRVTGREAETIGLVNAALPADEVLPHAVAYVRGLAERCSPTSMAIMKRQVYEQLHAGLGPAEQESQRLMVESFGRPDFAEGVRSFLDKRPPRFGRLGGYVLATPVANFQGDAAMAHEFLSDDWFAAVEALGPPPAPAGPDPGPINIVVTRPDGANVEIHLSSGAMSRGLADGAPTTITTPYDVAKALFVKRDQQAAMQAFMSGQIKVQGDMTKIMAMGTQVPTPEQEAFATSILELTEA